MQKKILIIQDNKTVAEYLALLLRNENYSVELAFTGRQAIHFLKTNEFNLVFLGLVLSDIPGVKILKNIRLTKSSDMLPIIVFSSIIDKSKVAEVFQYGANDFLTKPFSELVLKMKTNNLLLRQQTFVNKGSKL